MSWSFAALMVVSLGQAPEPSDSTKGTENQRQAEVAQLAQRVAQEQTFVVGTERKSLTVQPKPVLRWSNPTAGEVYGDVFVWTDRGRPALVASIYRWFQPDWGATLELCALTAGPIAGQREGREFWQPASPGIAWYAAPEAPTPAATSAARLSQMKSLAGDVAATLVDTRNVAQPVSRELRLMPQPLFRYPAPEEGSDYADGALFAFVEGTDPEVLLLVEASHGGATWRYGLARMNRDELRVSIREKAVWHVPYLPPEKCLQNPQQHYSLFVVNSDTGHVRP